MRRRASRASGPPCGGARAPGVTVSLKKRVVTRRGPDDATPTRRRVFTRAGAAHLVAVLLDGRVHEALLGRRLVGRALQCGLALALALGRLLLRFLPLLGGLEQHMMRRLL